jgi:branched-chain amino acid transport system ATP-binding protein
LGIKVKSYVCEFARRPNRMIVSIQKLSAGYGKLIILHDLSLVAGVNQFTAILGPNGSGKSTLLKSIFGLTKIAGGSIQIGEQELVGMSTEQISDLGISYVPQRENVFSALSVRENLRLALRKLDRSHAGQTLHDAYQLFPILAKREHQRAGQLSGGERQMLAIAIGWLLRPGVMLLDEPSAGLSPLLTKEVFRTLRHLASQKLTLIVVEQNARSILQWCDYVHILREGQLAFQGTAEECRANEDLVKQYLGTGVTSRSSPR